MYDVVDDGRSTSSLRKLEMHRSRQQTAVETADEEAYRAVTDKLNKQKPRRSQQQQQQQRDNDDECKAIQCKR